MRTKLTIDLQHFYCHLKSQKINYEVLKEYITSMSFFNKAREVMVGKFKIEGPIVLTEGEYGDGFNYSVKSWANIEILMDENSSITNPMDFYLTIKVEGDDVTAVKNNRIDICDKF